MTDDKTTPKPRTYAQVVEDGLRQTVTIPQSLTEIAIDSFLDPGTLKSMPVVGSLFALGRAVTTISDGLLLKKVVTMLHELNDTTEEGRAKLYAQLEVSLDHREQVGEAVLTVLDKADRLFKAQLIGRMFRAVAKGNISGDEALHCAFMINSTYVSDLHALAKHAEYRRPNGRYPKLFTSESVGEGFRGIGARLVSSGLGVAEANGIAVSGHGYTVLVHGFRVRDPQPFLKAPDTTAE